MCVTCGRSQALLSRPFFVSIRHATAANPDPAQLRSEDFTSGDATACRGGYRDYDGLDVAAYQRERIGAFAAMLRHLDKMPVKGD